MLGSCIKEAILNKHQFVEHIPARDQISSVPRLWSGSMLPI
jgi:hypothetical protein